MTSHEQCPPRLYQSSMRPNKAAGFLLIALWFFLPKFRLVIKRFAHVRFFSSIEMPLTWKHIMQWINVLASSERKRDLSSVCLFKRLLHKFYTLKNSYKLNEHIKLTFVSNGHYLYMLIRVHNDTYPLMVLCNSVTNRHEICTRLIKWITFMVWKFSTESVIFHCMTLTIM